MIREIESCYCNVCGRYYRGYHQCPPAWLVLDKDLYGDDWTDAETVHAHTAEDAAEEAAERLDNMGDGPSRRTLHVKLAECPGEEKVFDITFDYSVDYYAEEKKPT